MDGDFNGSLVLSIKETLTSLLGLKIYDALAYQLFKFHDITPEEIPYRLDAVDVALKQNFGSSFPVMFQDYVEDAKRRVEHRSNAPR